MAERIESIHWYNLSKYRTSPYTFIISIGGRGIGKSYSMLEFLSRPHSSKFLYLRRMDKEFRMCCSDFGNPFKAINKDKERNVNIISKRNVGIIYNNEPNNIIGYAAPLSGCSALRGFDLSDVNNMFFDEFVGQKEVRSMRNEADAFFNLYETVNRNRELLGKEPVKCYLASNAVSLNSPILMELGIIPIIEKMVLNGQEKYRDRERGLLIDLPNVTELANMKENTALYRLVRGTKYHDHAIHNKFSYDSFFNVKTQPLDEYYPFAAFGCIYIYRHKTNGEFYACYTRGDCPYYSENKEDRIMFRRLMFRYKDYFYNGMMKFCDYQCKIILWEAVINDKI